MKIQEKDTGTHLLILTLKLKLNIMKLSKIILENKKYVVREELTISKNDIDKLTTAITDKLEDYLDTGNRPILEQTVHSAIKDLLLNNEE